MCKGFSFADDEEKMRDFWVLSKEDFLFSYSYLTEDDYEAMVEEIRKVLETRLLEWYW